MIATWLILFIDLTDNWIPNIWSLVSRYIQLRTEPGTSADCMQDMEIDETEIKTKCNEIINMVSIIQIMNVND